MVKCPLALSVTHPSPNYANSNNKTKTDPKVLRKHSCQQTQILGSGIQADRALSLQGAESTFNFKPPGIWQLSTHFNVT